MSGNFGAVRHAAMIVLYTYWFAALCANPQSNQQITGALLRTQWHV